MIGAVIIAMHDDTAKTKMEEGAMINREQGLKMEKQSQIRR